MFYCKKYEYLIGFYKDKSFRTSDKSYGKFKLKHQKLSELSKDDMHFILNLHRSTAFQRQDLPAVFKPLDTFLTQIKMPGILALEEYSWIKRSWEECPPFAPYVFLVFNDSKYDVVQVRFLKSKLSLSDMVELSHISPKVDHEEIAKVLESRVQTYKIHNVFIPLKDKSNADFLTVSTNRTGFFNPVFCKSCPFFDECKDSLTITKIDDREDESISKPEEFLF